MKTFGKRILSLFVTVLIGAMTFAMPTSAQDNLESNYEATLELFHQHQDGDIVTLDDGNEYMIWSQELLPSDDNPNEYYISTQYISYEENPNIDYESNDLFSIFSVQTTPAYSVGWSYAYNTNLTIYVTMWVRFMYDGSDYPSVYDAGYTYFDNTHIMDLSWDKPSTFFLTKSCTQGLSFNYLTFLDGWKSKTISVTCNKDGTKG